MTSAEERLGSEYDLDTGFIGRLRGELIFDEDRAERYLSELASLEVGDSISLELAQIIWHLPVMLSWQLDWAEPGSYRYKQIESVLNRTVYILTDVNGVP